MSIRVKLLSFTPDPDSVVYAAARCCYDDVDMTDESYNLVNDKKQISKLINHLYISGHTSTFEHVSFTFAINGISRVCSHQLVRHRISSYSQASQRYIKMNTNKNMEDVVIPPSIKNKQSAYDLYRASVDTATSIYHSLISMGIPKEDARYVLPHSWTTQLSVTMNARSLLHFFSLRLCKRSQWEIRELARLMYLQVKDVAPLLFNYVGPSCLVEGKCNEAKPCGNPYKDISEFNNSFIILD